MRPRFSAALAGTVALLLASAAPYARAEVKEVVLAQQFGAVYLPMMVMESQKLVEKHLGSGGLAETTVKWAKLGGPAALNDGLLSGNIHFSPQGVPSLATIWSRTKDGNAVKAVGAVANNNIWLNTRNKSLKSLKDFTEKDRIAVPSLKVSTQAMLLHIGAEKLFGQGKHASLDHITVALPHPEALAAVLNPVHEINSHFATSPFNEIEKKAGLHTVTTAYEIMGGPMTGLTWVTTTKFRTENPKTFKAVDAAYSEALAWITADNRRAGELFITMTKEKQLTADDMVQMMKSGDLQFTRTPQQVGKIVDFMFRAGTIKAKADSWRDLFFAEAHGLPGS